MSKAAVQMKSIWHKDLADWLLVNGGKPGWNKAAAEHFGRGQAWISTVIHSDAFQDYFGKRRAAMSDVGVFTARERMIGILDQTLDKIEEKLENGSETLSLGNLLDTADILAKRTGHGEGKSSEQTLVTTNIQIVTKEQLEESRARMRGSKPLVLEASKEQAPRTSQTDGQA